LTHAALAKNALAARDPIKNKLTNAFGVSKANLMKQEDEKWMLEMRFLESTKNEGTTKEIDVEETFTEYGAGLLGLIPLIEPKFREKTLGWDNSFKTEADLDARLSTFAFSRLL